ncbi:hypothetical protein AaE_010884 [Aphanomyces astaci]|uniref:Protein kinase domain-containing protein n=1 Tax=Aphanomyces astaci TaxID=112090 RepID=A0A6A4ZX15_APHAT|nr:hypothetical protein AaE_010884 [Aphanomyces astaci]
MREIRLSAYFHHPAIVEFVGISWLTLKDMSIVTEFMVNGDVYSVLRHQRQLPSHDQWLRWYPLVAPDESDHKDQNGGSSITLGFHSRVAASPSKLSMALQIAQALVYLHSMRVVHRDIKSQNVVLNTLFTAKLCDFGISRRISLLMTANKGTIAYMAPEVTMLHYQYNIYMLGF